MALIDLNSTGPAFDPARFAKTFRDSDTRIPSQALLRLSVLHREAGRDLHLSQFLAGAPRFCVALMLAGAVTLGWASRDESSAPQNADFASDFIWAASILIGIVAMTHTHIRNFARSPGWVPLDDAASRLRMLLLYMGVVWGGGAFLVTPARPVLALAFVAGPSLACALTLKDEKGVIAFGAPAALLTASAALPGARPAGAWVAGAALAAGAAIAGFSMLQCAIRRRQDSLPALR